MYPLIDPIGPRKDASGGRPLKVGRTRLYSKMLGFPEAMLVSWHHTALCTPSNIFCNHSNLFMRRGYHDKSIVQTLLPLLPKHAWNQDRHLQTWQGCLPLHPALLFLKQCLHNMLYYIPYNSVLQESSLDLRIPPSLSDRWVLLTGSLLVPSESQYAILG